jgi:NADH:ubiquinone oxidoreductase subunit 4 (subunit M)
MSIRLITFILLPLVAVCMEFFIPKKMNKFSGVFSMITSALCLILSIMYFFHFNPEGASPQFVEYYLWLPQWAISFKLAVDGINLIFIMLFTTVLLLVSVIGFTEKRQSTYFILLMVFQVACVGSLLAYDLVVKLIFWEAVWVPVFFLILTENKEKVAKTFSIYWFASETLIILAVVLMNNSLIPSFDIAEIIGKSPYNDKSNIIFGLLIVASMIRTGIFPFDNWLSYCTRTCSNTTALPIVTILPNLSLIFILNIVTTVLSKSMQEYITVLSIIYLVSAGVSVLRLYIKKSLESLISNHLILYNSLIMLWLGHIKEAQLQAVTELIVLGTILNIGLIHLGNVMREKSQSLGLNGLVYKDKVNTWLFISIILLCYGIPGLTVTKPIFFLINKWFAVSQWISFTTVAIIALSFVLTSLIIIPVFSNLGQETKTSIINRRSITSIITIVVFVVTACFSIAISLQPQFIYKLSSGFYSNYIEKRGA